MILFIILSAMKVNCISIFSFVVFTFCHLFSARAFSQDIIKWSQLYKLKWTDFRGTPDTTLGLAAVTSSGISCKSLFTDTSFKFDVFAFFEKNKSWKTTAANADILIHEQGHFDISEICCRKLEIELKKLIPRRPTIQADVNNLVKKINLIREQMQDRYDAETDYGRDSAAQQRWATYINGELSKHP